MKISLPFAMISCHSLVFILFLSAYPDLKRVVTLLWSYLTSSTVSVGTVLPIRRNQLSLRDHRKEVKISSL
jgi:hypothetical protein